jgi:diadenosine tetraphosphate (Ap4A) HIT family hydrolase
MQISLFTVYFQKYKLKAMQDKCIFCGGEDPVKEKYPIFWKGENFFIKPVLGTLKDGFTLTIPNRHVISFGELSRSELDDFFYLKKEVDSIYNKVYGQVPMLWENSGNKVQKFSNSIEHAHMHTLPHKLSRASIDTLTHSYHLKQIDFKGGELEEFAGTRYLLYVSPEGDAFVSENGIPIKRQHMRQLIAAELGIPDKWNWREHDLYEEHGKNTIIQLQEPLSKL